MLWELQEVPEKAEESTKCYLCVFFELSILRNWKRTDFDLNLNTTNISINTKNMLYILFFISSVSSASI